MDHELGRVAQLYFDTFPSRLSDLFLAHADITFKDLEEFYTTVYDGHPGTHFEIACLISDEIGDVLKSLDHVGAVEQAKNLRTGLDEFREREHVPVDPHQQ